MKDTVDIGTVDQFRSSVISYLTPIQREKDLEGYNAIKDLKLPYVHRLEKFKYLFEITDKLKDLPQMQVKPDAYIKNCIKDKSD